MIERTIRMSPSEYINEDGVLKKLPEILKNHKWYHPVILTDKTVYPLLNPYLPPNFLNTYPTEFFKGACTFEEIDRLSELFQDYDVIIAFGGGQLMDTAKMVSNNIGIQLINIQTVPSNCAAITTKSIIYSEKHEKIANERQFKPVDMVLLEPELLINSPFEYILSGIGDTLAKYYEIRRRLTKEKTSLLTVEIGRIFIEICRREMLQISSIDDLNGKKLQNFIDTIFLVAATVDGIADKDGWSVAAHAFHNAYVKVKNTKRSTHGEIVALGNLFQVLLEEELDLVEEIVTYHRLIGLPLSLADIGIADQQDIEEMARYIIRKEDFRVQTIFPEITYAEVIGVLQKLKEGY